MRSLLRPLGQVKRNYRRQRSVETLVVGNKVKGDVKAFGEIPGPKGIYNIPFFGAMFFFKPFTKYSPDTVHCVFNELIDQYGPLVRVRLGEWTVLVEDPTDIDLVRRSEGPYPQRRLYPIHTLYCEKTGFRKGFAHLQGEEWKNFRSPVNARMLRSHSALQYLAVQNQVADDLVTRLHESRSQPDTIIQLFYKYACESIGVVTYNKRLDFLSADTDTQPERLQVLKDIKSVFRMVSDNQHIPEVITKYLPIREKKMYKEVADRLASYARSNYEKTITEIQQPEKDNTVLGTEENNFMFSLMKSDKMCVSDMVAIAMELFVAGTDSVARNLQLVLYNLARNPDKQQILYEEVLRVLGPSAPLDEQALKEISYLPATLKESFRVTYPIVSGTQRYLPTDIVLKGYNIPRGTSVVMMNQKTAKNEKYFTDPDSFLPERWMRDNTGNRTVPIPPSSLLPFGFGPRQCLGKKFAEQEIYLAVTKILQAFEVCLEPDHEEIEINYHPFIGTRKPIRFLFKERY